MQLRQSYVVVGALALFWLVFVRRLLATETENATSPALPAFTEDGSETATTGGVWSSEIDPHILLPPSSDEVVEVEVDDETTEDKSSSSSSSSRRRSSRKPKSSSRLLTNGVREGSFVYAGDEGELPAVFPVRDDGDSDAVPPITVCVFERNPRQRSLFSTNMLSLFGSGRYTYQTMTATDCQHYGRCTTPQESNQHPSCPPGSPTVGLVEWVKCCFHDRFTAAMTSKTQNWDVAIATGDEYCAATDRGRAHFRFYFRDNVDNFLPLGPREEFIRVPAKNVVPAANRKYLFNFVGSLTSTSRKILEGVLQRRPSSHKRGFVHVVDEWSKTLSHKNGYLLPYEYRLVLMNSTFTLCPDGHNPESYRIYEALEAGSIPVLVMDSSYDRHTCQDSFRPLLEAKAPFVFLQSWRQLDAYLAQVKPEEVARMQANAMAWYSDWMQRKAKAFEKVLDDRYAARTGGK